MVEIKEVDDAVEDLNAEMYEANDDTEFVFYELRSSGDCLVVRFAGQHIWDSEDDMRKDIAEDQPMVGPTYEPLKPYLRKEAGKIVKELLLGLTRSEFNDKAHELWEELIVTHKRLKEEDNEERNTTERGQG